MHAIANRMHVMKRFVLPALALLLCGCAAGQTLPTEPDPMATVETAAAASETTVPPVIIGDITFTQDPNAQETTRRTRETTEEESQEETTTEEETTARPFDEDVIYFGTGRKVDGKVREINARTMGNSEAHVYDIFNMPTNGAVIADMIESYQFPNAPYIGGGPVYDEIVEFLKLNRNAAGARAQANMTYKYGIMPTETDLRSFPTDIYLSDEEHRYSVDKDYFQESTLFAGEAICIMHTSADGRFVFVAGTDYCGWIPVGSYIEVSREMAYAFANTDSFAVVKGAFIYLNVDDDYESKKAKVAAYMSMGTVLPYLAQDSCMLLPVMEDPEAYLYMNGGWLVYSDEYVEGAENIGVRHVKVNFGNASIGYMDFTEDNIDILTKELEDTAYSWGGRGLGYDCSSAVRSIYRCVGIIMPRNSGIIRYCGMDYRELTGSDEEKLAAIQALPRGSLLLMPGHVMVYIGGGRIIHAVEGYRDSDGEWHSAMSVVQTDLGIMRYDETKYISLMYGVMVPTY